MERVVFDNLVVKDNRNNLRRLRDLCRSDRMSMMYGRWARINDFPKLLRACGFKARPLSRGEKVQIKEWRGDRNDIGVILSFIETLE